MVTNCVDAEQRVILKNISWETFANILGEMGEDKASRLTYDQGKLEIMTAFLPHEHINRLIERLIFVLGEELNLEIFPGGATTFSSKDFQYGVTPDSCYYIQQEELVRSQPVVDFQNCPAPDLVVEIDFSQTSLDKFHLYAAFGVTELWRYHNGILNIYHLQQGQYIQGNYSQIFAHLPLIGIPKFLEESQKVGAIAMMKVFRKWVRIMLGNK